jgi:hypothetical protein
LVELRIEAAGLSERAAHADELRELVKGLQGQGKKAPTRRQTKLKLDPKEE